MKLKTIESINQYNSKTVNPLKKPDEWYELYSVPNFEFEVPEILQGKDIASSKQVVEEGDILISKINPRINRVWIVGNYSEHLKIASSEWIVIRNSEISSKYLSYYFKTDKFRKLLCSQVTGIGGSLTRAQPKNVKGYKVPIFSKDYQEKVANILDKMNELIKLRQSQITALDELTSSIFFNTLKGELTNARLEDLVLSTQNGMSRRGDDANGEIVLKLKNVKGNTINFKDVNRISLEQKEKENYKLNVEDLLFVRVNGNPNYVGRSAVFRGHSEDVYFNDHIIRTVVKNVNVGYLSYLLNSSLGIAEIQKNIKTSAGQYTISRDGINKIKLRLPEQTIQDEFINKKFAIDIRKKKLKETLIQMNTLYNSLLQKAFKGDLFQE
ncbi:hypothetical protein CN540_28080 [Bacillus toyonensis]|uniref:restriction endonuclease subunit S n=1 Tax=Bacillus toyonensis TaxID=155322 RepID=UPI000BF0F39F|nr:restriction endonuclease subunit S [Bacillus toyonensis]PEN47596.1 hypothetical protein CN540_28080 [Bacillus toyonensis]